tara:strand:- start:1151 stop:2593 length:1443 start_codon:yes stop_codon:yes gene_type:complete
MALTRVKFEEWYPDQPHLLGALKDAKNVIPTTTGYTYFNDKEAISNSAAQNLIRVFPAKFGTQTQLFAASTSKLFKYSSADLDLDDVSKLSGGSPGSYTTTDRWSFTQFGTKLLCANKQDRVQAWTIGSSSNFADLDASAPTAHYITVVRDFVVCARDNSNPSKVFWSDINDETDWTPATTSQSDTQIIPDGGNILGITGGEFGLVLLERGIHRMSYIGSPFYFQFDNISRGIGCFAEGSITQYGQITFFLSDDGFYMCNGSQVTPIGTQKVDRFFFNDLNSASLSNLSAAVDPINKLVIWCYPNNNDEQALLIYNWQIQKWSRAIVDVDFISTGSIPSVTLEGLDLYSSSIDDLTTSLDSRLWVGGNYALAGVKDDKIVTFTGNKLSGEIVTGDIDMQGNSIINLARPLVENGSANVSVASRIAPSDTITFPDYVSPSSENRVPLRAVGRFHRVKVQPTGDNWDSAVAIDLEVNKLGTR